MENGIDLNKFYQGLDDLFQQKDSGQTIGLSAALAAGSCSKDRTTSGIVAVSNELGGALSCYGSDRPCQGFI